LAVLHLLANELLPPHQQKLVPAAVFIQLLLR
jgi:hypothetical protein